MKYHYIQRCWWDQIQRSKRWKQLRVDPWYIGLLHRVGMHPQLHCALSWAISFVDTGQLRLHAINSLPSHPCLGLHIVFSLGLRFYVKATLNIKLWTKFNAPTFDLQFKSVSCFHSSAIRLHLLCCHFKEDYIKE